MFGQRSRAQAMTSSGESDWTSMESITLDMFGVPVWLAVVLASLGVGAIQPYLFRDLKYA